MFYTFNNICFIIGFFAPFFKSKNICKYHFFHSPSSADDGQLIFAHTICRHGDRNLFSPTYPTDPWKSEEFWPEGFAELTQIGKQQHFELGQYFRERYPSLIGFDGYSPKKVYIESTDVDRVLMSAQSNLAGMFPPNDYQIWNPHVFWQPVPVHTRPYKDEYILALKKPCKRYIYKRLQFLNESNFNGFIEQYRLLIKYLEENAGLQLPKLTDLLYLHDKLFVQQLKFKTLPHWAQAVMLPSGDFEHLTTYWFNVSTETPDMKRLRSGFLLKEMLDRFTNKIQSALTPDRSLWMYFAHDYTVADLLNSLGLYEPHRPPYASCILFELRKIREVPFVQVFYKNSTDINISPLEIPNCGSKCPLEQMYKLYEPILPTQSIEKECALRDGEHSPDEKYRGNDVF